MAGRKKAPVSTSRSETAGSGIQPDGSWQPQFEGQRPPFAPGNTLAIANRGLTAEQLRDVGLGALVPQDEHPVFEELHEQQAEERRRRGEPHGLTAEEVEGADQGEMDLARYATLRDVRNLDDFEAAQKRLRLDAEARAEAERQAAVERVKRRLAAEQSGNEAA